MSTDKATKEELTIAGYINDVQFMTDCWSRDFSYVEYVDAATRVGKYVHDEASYKSHCVSQEEQMAEYVKDASLALEQADTMNFNMSTFGTIDVPNT